MVSLTVLIRTKGRPTLGEAVKSAMDADEVVVLSDGVEGLEFEGVKVVYYPKTGCFGFPMLMDYLPQVKTSHVTVQDDDDYYYEGAIGRVKEIMEREKADVGIFPVFLEPRHFEAEIYPRHRKIEVGNVCFTGFVWRPEYRVEIPWSEERMQDWKFMQAVMDQAAVIHPAWDEKPIGHARSLP